MPQAEPTTAMVCNAACQTQADCMALRALALARDLPRGAARDATLAAVSRNLRGSGHEREGVAAARAMTGENGPGEVHAALTRVRPRWVPLSEADPAAACNDVDWIVGRRDHAGEAAVPVVDRVTRCFDGPHEFGGPSRGRAEAVYAALPPGPAKAILLDDMVSLFQDAATTRWAAGEFPTLAAYIPVERRAGLAVFLARSEALWWLGRLDEAKAAARRTTNGWHVVSLIDHVLEDGQVDEALALLPVLAGIPDEFAGDGCEGWFSSVGLLQSLVNTFRMNAPPQVYAALVERLPADPVVRARCPGGLPPETRQALLIGAGRIPEALAISAASADPLDHALLVDQMGHRAYDAGRVAEARAYWEQAVRVLPPIPRTAQTAPWNIAARLGIGLAEALAATGALDRAGALAESYPNAAWRALLLSAAVSGRNGLDKGLQGHRAEQVSPDTVPLAPDR